MKITKKEIEHIAGLARIKLTDKEKNGFTKEFGAILDYFKKLEKAELRESDNLEKTDSKNIMRLDEEVRDRELGSLESRKKILKLAPEIKDNFIKVKAVLK